MVELFIKTVLAQLKARFSGLRHSSDRVLDLESGTDAKFSRHLIFADAVCADNIQAGLFVREVRAFRFAVAPFVLACWSVPCAPSVHGPRAG